MKHPPRDWTKLGKCCKVIQPRPQGGWYFAIAVNSDGLLAVTDGQDRCVHLITNDGTLVRSIGKKVLGVSLYGVSFDLKGNVWVTDNNNRKLVKLSQNDRLLHDEAIRIEGNRSSKPWGVSVSTESQMYICDSDNRRVTVHDKGGKFLFAFGSEGSVSGCFGRPSSIAFDSDGFVYVVDRENKRVSVWSKEGIFKTTFEPKCSPTCIATTNDNHLLITSEYSHSVMVYTLDGKLIHQFGGKGRDHGKFNVPCGVCVHDDSGLVYVYVVDRDNHRIQVFC